MDELITLCKNSLQKLLNISITHSNSVFHELTTYIANLIVVSTSHNGQIKEVKSVFKCSMVFYFGQIISSLELLGMILSKEIEVKCLLKECRKSVCQRIIFCLDGISNLSSDDVPSNPSGCFLKWIDNALAAIAEVDIALGVTTAIKQFNEAKSLFEDVLAHAMSIAQVCLPQDNKAITGSSQSVIASLDDLENELTKDEANKAMVDLFVDSCGDKLCALERRVDLAILRMSLQVFSRNVQPLDDVYNICKENSRISLEQQVIDNLVADFDLHVDQMMQIGLFAIYCSTNTKNGSNLRNCMASLEFLEPEIIPAILMLLTDSSQMNNAIIYKNYWISESNKLKKWIFEIIDPTAFSQVVCDEIGDELDDLLSKHSKGIKIEKNLYQNIMNFANVLTDFVSTSIRSEDINDEHALKEIMYKCSLITKEIEKAVELLDDSLESNGRILKRCRILKAEIKKLVLYLKKGGKENVVNSNVVVSEEKYKDSVVIEERNNLSGNIFLNQIIQKGKEILQNRSILYRTPKKSFKLSEIPHEKQGKLKSVDSFLKRISARALSFSFNASSEIQSVELNLTDILDNLTNLSNTFQTFTK